MAGLPDPAFGTRVIGADRVAAQLAATSPRVALAVNQTTRTFGAELLRTVRGKASGRPGPRSQTGDYRRTINLRVLAGPTTVVATVGTNAPQARRLEFGFAAGIGPQNGVDVLGRHFSQAPYPHFGPAADEVGPRYRAAVAAAVRQAVAR